MANSLKIAAEDFEKKVTSYYGYVSVRGMVEVVLILDTKFIFVFKCLSPFLIHECSKCGTLGPLAQESPTGGYSIF